MVSNLLTDHILFASICILQFSYLFLLVDSTVKEPNFNLCKWVSPDNNKCCSEEAKVDKDGLSERKSSISQLRCRGTSGMFFFIFLFGSLSMDYYYGAVANCGVNTLEHVYTVLKPHLWNLSMFFLNILVYHHQGNCPLTVNFRPKSCSVSLKNV